MAIVNPRGNCVYWFNGQPFKALYNQEALTETCKYWFNGFPANFVLPTNKMSNFFLVF